MPSRDAELLRHALHANRIAFEQACRAAREPCRGRFRGLSGAESHRAGDSVEHLGQASRLEEFEAEVAGDEDVAAHLTTAGAAWFADPYLLSPGRKSLVTLFGAGHLLGGVSGYDVAETTDENPERVATVQLLTWAYLRSQLYAVDSSWQEAQKALTGAAKPLGRVESK
jgi:hypothetical protein